MNARCMNARLTSSTILGEFSTSAPQQHRKSQNKKTAPSQHNQQTANPMIKHILISRVFQSVFESGRNAHWIGLREEICPDTSEFFMGKPMVSGKTVDFPVNQSSEIHVQTCVLWTYGDLQRSDGPPVGPTC